MEDVCEYCGPGCVGGAAHFARMEDGVKWAADAEPEKQEKRPELYVGWCSSCDKMADAIRPECPECGDWLVFGIDPDENQRLRAENVRLTQALKTAKEFIENLQLPDREWSRTLDIVVAALANAAKLKDAGVGH